MTIGRFKSAVPSQNTPSRLPIPLHPLIPIGLRFAGLLWTLGLGLWTIPAWIDFGRGRDSQIHFENQRENLYFLEDSERAWHAVFNMGNEYVDYLIVTTTGDHDDFEKYPPFKGDIALLNDTLRIGRSDGDIAEKIMDACESRGLNFKPTRQFGMRYIFKRVRPPTQNEGKENVYQWDPDGLIRKAVAISRLIYPTPIGFEYSARASFKKGQNEIESIIPGPVNYHGAEAYTQNNKRTWLTDSEVSQLAELLSVFLKRENYLPNRFKRALWFFEYSFGIDYLDVRWPLMATVIEALINTDSEKTVKQFSVRLAGLAKEVGINKIDQAYAETIFKEVRSPLVHGQSLISDIDDPKLADMYEQTELAIRLSLRRMIEDELYADLFSDDAKIRSKWPL